MASAQSEFESKVFVHLSKGDLEGIKSMYISKDIINEPFLMKSEYKIPGCDVFPSITSPTLLVLSILFEKPEIMRYLIEQGADVNIRVEGWLPIHFAASIKCHKCLQYLLDVLDLKRVAESFVIDPFKCSESKNNALHVAVSNLRHKSALLLCTRLNAVSDIENSYSSSGNTPLHMAAYLGDMEMCSILLSCGADIDLENDDGLTPDFLADSLGFRELSEKLNKFEPIPLDVLNQKYLGITAPIESEEASKDPDSIEELRSELENLRKRVEELEMKALD